MEQLLLRIFDTELGQFYMKYREAQSGVVARPFPPSKQSVKLPLAKVLVKIEKGLYFYVELTRHDSGERLCVVHVDAQSYQNDLAAHLAWEPEAVEFIDGFLQWLTSNFHTDTAQEPTTPEQQARMKTLEDVVLEAMTENPAKGKGVSQQAYEQVFRYFESLGIDKVDYAGIAYAAGVKPSAVRTAFSRYMDHKRDESYKT